MADEEKNTTEEQQAENKPEEADKAEEAPKQEENKPEEKAAEEVAEEAKTEEAPAEDTESAEGSEESPAEEAEEEVSEEPAEEVTPEEAQQKIETGMIVRVHLKIKDVTPKGEERERIQIFEGTVIAKKGRSAETATITVRKVSKGFGVERIFPLNMPTIDKIEIVKRFRTRRSKLYFLREKFKKRLKEVPVDKKN